MQAVRPQRVDRLVDAVALAVMDKNTALLGKSLLILYRTDHPVPLPFIEAHLVTRLETQESLELLGQPNSPRLVHRGSHQPDPRFPNLQSSFAALFYPIQRRAAKLDGRPGELLTKWKRLGQPIGAPGANKGTFYPLGTEQGGRQGPKTGRPSGYRRIFTENSGSSRYRYAP